MCIKLRTNQSTKFVSIFEPVTLSLCVLSTLKWATTCENLFMLYAVCKQQMQISLHIHVLSNQHLCYSLPRKYNISSFFIRNFKPPASVCNWAGWFESYLVKKSRRQVSTKECCRTRRLNPRPSACQVDAHPTKLPGPAYAVHEPLICSKNQMNACIN